tara:strand:- start:29 stop:763 length:735 start_codon:yes stop_codon:yes gene_type:complete
MDNIKTNFGKIKVNKEEKTKLVQNLFSDVSEKYDLMNDIMSFGAHRLWKRNLVQMMNIQPNDEIIDVGSGTGDLLKLILEKKLNTIIYSVDLNKEMLKKSKNKYKNKRVKFINANAEKLPLKNNKVDKYVISFCLRNITFIDEALNEALRVLKPGGIFYCLEFSTPSSNIIKSIYSKYKNKLIPIMGEKFANNKQAYEYLEKSISQFPNQEILLEKIKNIGFENVTFTNLFNGIVSIHKGYKIL